MGEIKPEKGQDSLSWSWELYDRLCRFLAEYEPCVIHLNNPLLRQTHARCAESLLRFARDHALLTGGKDPFADYPPLTRQRLEEVASLLTEPHNP